MQIQDLLFLHHAAPAPGRPVGLPDVLGDGYLRRHNPIYTNVLRAAADLGTTFAEAWPRYLLLPFHELETIKAQKTVPFIATARLLREIESACPGVLAIDEIALPESYHLHEAAHIVAEHLAKALPTTSERERILKILACESFANTVDALAGFYADDETHRCFLGLNCYMKPRKAAVEAMRKTTKRLGAAFTETLIFMSYLYANFLRDGVPESVVEALKARFAPEIALSRASRRDVAVLAELGQHLDPLFRVRTTSTHFKMLGFAGEIYDLLDFSPELPGAFLPELAAFFAADTSAPGLAAPASLDYARAQS